MGRWDFLYDIKPVAAVEVLLDEAAKSLVEDLQRWPPPVELVEAGLDGAAVTLLLLGPRPHPSVYRSALHLVRLDLQREFDELEAWRSEGWKSAQHTPVERDTAVFLWRYVSEWIYGMSEAVRSPLGRPKLLALVDRIERRLVAPSILH
jgi:hypothetical protein